MAPGCQLVSVKIGGKFSKFLNNSKTDVRVKGEETGPGLIRGLMVAAELGCDIINMSYGEAADMVQN